MAQEQENKTHQWHKKQWELLTTAARAGKLAHSLIFSGQEHLGKRDFALRFIEFLNNQQELRYPDLMVIEPEGKEIKIDQIRDIKKEVALKPRIGDLQAVIIDKAHLLNQEAQNCFLKLLEEPPQNVYFFLICLSAESFLPTIKSRCQTIKFFPLPEQEMRVIFKRYQNHENFDFVLGVAQGRPSLAQAFFDNAALLDKKIKNFQQANTILSASQLERMLLSKEFFPKNKESQPDDQPIFLPSLLGDIAEFARLLLLKNIGVADFAWLSHQAKQTAADLKKILVNIEQLQFLLDSSNINQRVAFENFLLSF